MLVIKQPSQQVIVERPLCIEMTLKMSNMKFFNQSDVIDFSGHAVKLILHQWNRYIRSTRLYVGSLLRSESPSGKCAKLHTVAASNNRDHASCSLCYCLFAPHIYGWYSSRTSRSWWVAYSTQLQRIVCNTAIEANESDVMKIKRQKVFFSGVVFGALIKLPGRVHFGMELRSWSLFVCVRLAHQHHLWQHFEKPAQTRRNRIQDPARQYVRVRMRWELMGWSSRMDWLGIGLLVVAGIRVLHFRRPLLVGKKLLTSRVVRKKIRWLPEIPENLRTLRFMMAVVVCVLSLDFFNGTEFP